MIYLEEKFNLIPASPVTLEEFVNFAQEQLVPICERLGARLIAGWYTNSEWFSQGTAWLQTRFLGTCSWFCAGTCSSISTMIYKTES